MLETLWKMMIPHRAIGWCYHAHESFMVAMYVSQQEQPRAKSEKGATVYRVMREQQVNWPKWSETGRRGPRPADAGSHGTRRRRRPVRRSNQTASQRHEVSLSQSGRSAHERTSARSLSPYTSSEVLTYDCDVVQNTLDWGKRNHQTTPPATHNPIMAHLWHNLWPSAQPPPTAPNFLRAAAPS